MGETFLFLFSDASKNTFEGCRLVCSTNTNCSRVQFFLFLHKQEWILEKIISSQELICSLTISKVFALTSLFCQPIMLSDLELNWEVENKQ